MARFRDPACEVVWAAIMSLGPEQQVAVLTGLQDLLAVDAFNSPSKRVARAVEALHETARILGHSPSVGEYRTLRAAHPEWRLPSDGAIRKHLGGSWNDALRRAFLEPVSDGDAFLSAAVGPSFTADEVEEALRACARASDGIPTLHQFLHWAQRDDIQSGPERVPRSTSPFDRIYGGFPEALAAAGLIEPDGFVEISAELVRPRSHALSDERILDALREVAGRLARSPYTDEYLRERKQIVKESRTAGTLRSLPCKTTIIRRFGSFDKALIAAGLEPTGGRSNPRRKPGPRRPVGPRVTDDRILECIREAYRENGEPFTRAVFSAWRRKRLDAGQINRGRTAIPSGEIIAKRFGSWPAAIEAAIPISPPAATSNQQDGGPADSAVSTQDELRPIGSSPAHDLGSLLRLSDDDFCASLRVAFGKLGEPFTGPRYAEWRRERRETHPDEFVPSLYHLKQRFGSFTEACHFGLPWLGAQKRRSAGSKLVAARRMFVAEGANSG